MADYDLKVIAPDTGFTTGNFLFGADNQGAATPVPYTADGIKTFMSASPTLVTPVIGAATGTSLALSGALTALTFNGLTITTSTGTLTIAAGKTLTVSNTLTLAGTDGTTMTFPGTSGTVATLGLAQTFTATKTFTGSPSIALGVAAGNTGAINLLGTTSGTVTLSVADAAGTWTMKLPVDAGTNNFVLKTDGAGVTSWVAQSGGSGITIGATTITSGTATRLLYETSSNVVGEVSGATSDGTTLTLVAPVLGAATATSINKVAITAPATSATLTLIDGTTLTGPAASGTAMTLGNAETVTGVKTFTAAAPQIILGVNTTTLGSIKLFGSTSGDATIRPAAVAGTATVITLPIVTGTLATLAGTEALTNKTLSGSTNVLGGVTMTLGSDADGDIYYRAAGVLTRLPLGTALHVLRVNAGATAPEWAAAAGGGGTPGGSVGDVQYNDGTSGFAAEAAFNYTAASNLLTLTGGRILQTGAVSSAAWTTTGLMLVQSAATLTDTSSSGTVATVYVNRLGVPTLAASASTTYTNAYNLWAEPPAAGSNVTMTKAYAAGFNGNVQVTGTIYLGGPFGGGWDGLIPTGFGIDFGSGNGSGGGIKTRVSYSGVYLPVDAQLVGGNSNSGGSGQDVFLKRAAPATWQFGTGDAAVAIGQTTQVQSVAAGTSNVAGANWTFRGSKGTGTGAGGQIILQTAPAGSTGTSQNALATGLTITAPAVNMQPSVVVGNQALATTATDGFLYIPTSAGTPTGVPTTFTGRVALIYDTTNFQFWIYDGAWKQPKTPAGAALVTWQ